MRVRVMELGVGVGLELGVGVGVESPLRPDVGVSVTRAARSRRSLAPASVGAPSPLLLPCAAASAACFARARLSTAAVECCRPERSTLAMC